MQKKGKFIVLEGIDGSGKTMMRNIVIDTLWSRGIEPISTREPGGTPIAESIRQILISNEYENREKMDALTETLLLFAARTQHVSKIIVPALKRGEWIVSERFTESTFAYQVGGRGIKFDTVLKLVKLVHDGMWPDLTIYLDVPPEIAAERISDKKKDRIEAEVGDFYECVREFYKDRAAYLDAIVEVDASKPQSVVASSVKAVVMAFLDKNPEDTA